MAKIEFRRLEDTETYLVRDRVPEGPMREKIGESELDNHTRMYFPGTSDSLQMFEAILEPNTGPEAHAHHEEEIVFVLAGEMHFGAQVLTPGDSAKIPKNTLYSFRAGPEGLRFLNFRARANGVIIGKDELMNMRAASGSAD